MTSIDDFIRTKSYVLYLHIYIQSYLFHVHRLDFTTIIFYLHIFRVWWSCLKPKLIKQQMCNTCYAKQKLHYHLGATPCIESTRCPNLISGLRFLNLNENEFRLKLTSTWTIRLNCNPSFEWEVYLITLKHKYMISPICSRQSSWTTWIFFGN